MAPPRFALGLSHYIDHILQQPGGNVALAELSEEEQGVLQSRSAELDERRGRDRRGPTDSRTATNERRYLLAQKGRRGVDRGPHQPRGVLRAVDQREPAIDHFVPRVRGRLLDRQVHDGPNSEAKQFVLVA